MKHLFTLLLLAVLGTAGAQQTFPDSLLTTFRKTSPDLLFHYDIPKPDTLKCWYKEVITEAAMPYDVWRKGYAVCDNLYTVHGNQFITHYLDQYKKPVTNHVIYSIERK